MRYDTEYTGTKINVRYLVAYLLDKTMLFLIFMIIFAVLFTSIGYKRKNDLPTDPMDILNGYRSTLTDEEAQAVEGLFTRYMMCLDQLYGYYGNMKCMTNVYRIGADKEYTEMLAHILVLSEEEYETISGIYGLQNNRAHHAFERVGIEFIQNISDYLEDGADTSYLSADPVSVLLTIVTVYGKDDVECEQVMGVIEQSFSGIINRLDHNGKISGLELLGSVTSLGNSYSLNEGLQKQTEGLVDVGTFLSGILTATNSFSDEQKVYYNALKQYERGRLGGRKEDSAKFSLKYPVLGAAFGLVISVGLSFIFYLCNGKIKSSDDLVSRYGIEVTDPVSFMRKKQTIISRWADKLRGIDNTKAEISKTYAFDNVLNKLQQSDAKKVVLLRADDSEASIEMSDVVRNDAVFSEIEFIGEGDPAVSSDLLRVIKESDAVVAVAELNSTKQAVTDKWFSICKRHNKPVSGIITVFSR